MQKLIIPAAALSLVDAHHHLWNLTEVHYPWLMARGVKRFFGDPAPIQKDYLVADLKRDIGALPVNQSVHIQVGAADSDTVTETAWLQKVADGSASGGMPQAIVAYCDLAAPDAPAVLAAQRQHGNVRGIRQIVGREPREDALTGSGALIDDRQWQRNLAGLASMDLSFDLQLIPPQLPAIIGLLKQMPDLPVALCHCGSPWDRSAEGMAFWRQQIGQLAQLPNVYCKLSGFGMFDPRWNTERVRPIVRHCIESFSPRRCMFGSNFPVDRLYRDYQSVFASYLELAAEYGADERRDLLGDTARRFYRLAAATESSTD